MNIRPLATMCLILSAIGLPGRVSAYSGESEIGYDTETATLSGYSRIWKDPADWDFDSSCIFWEYDIDFGFYCSRFHRRYTIAALFGEIYRESQDEPVSSEYAWGGESARTDYSTTFPAGDLWTAQADHFMEVDHYFVFCSLTIPGLPSCSPQFYVGTTVYPLAQTVDSERVCGVRQVDEIYREYRDDRYGSNIRPECEDFSDSGDSMHFTWSQLNGGFTDGNPHSSWGMVAQRLKNALDHIASNYANFDGILLISGYRCPHGNQNVGGVPHSYHTHGTAADLLRAGWGESEFENVASLARGLGAETLPYTEYKNNHLHFEFEYLAQ